MSILTLVIYSSEIISDTVHAS